MQYPYGFGIFMVLKVVQYHRRNAKDAFRLWLQLFLVSETLSVCFGVKKYQNVAEMATQD
jgi:hypothetical protein